MNKEYFLKRLLNRFPTRLETNSYDSLPDTFLAHDKVTIECHIHGLFDQKAYAHLNGINCPECGSIQNRNNCALTTEEFVANSKKKFGHKFDYSRTIYHRRDEDIQLACPRHGVITLKPWEHMQYKFGCLQCGVDITSEIKRDKAINRAKKIHGDRYDYSKMVFLGDPHKVEIVCPEHGSFLQTVYNHCVLGTGCPRCSRENDKLKLSDFIEKSRKLFGNQYDYSKVVYESNTSKVTITCPQHGDWVQRAASHLAGNGCKKCFEERNRSNTEEFVKNAVKIHGDTYDYSRVNYKNNKKPVELICKIHGSFWIKPNSHVSSGNSCRFCYESKGEKAVARILEKHGLTYVREYRIEPHRYRYDFYLPTLNIFIEYHGEQHYRPVELFGGDLEYVATKQRDEIKRDLARQSGTDMIVLNFEHRSRGRLERVLFREIRRLRPLWKSFLKQ